MAGHSLLLATVLLLALVAQPTAAQLIGRLAARITNRLDASPVAATNATTCPVTPANTQLNFTSLITACPATSTDNTTVFCDACICALTDAYMPALEAAGVFNITGANASATATEMLAAATAVVRACSASFLTPALAAGVEIGGLTRLSTQCNFTASSVPACLREKLAALQPAPAPLVTSSDLRSAATAGGDYITDNSSALTTDVLRSAASGTPVTATTPGAVANATATPSNATVVPVTNGTAATTPAATTPLGTTVPAATDPLGADYPSLTPPGAATPAATTPAAATPSAAAAGAAFPDYTPATTDGTPPADTPVAVPAATTPATTPETTTAAPPVASNPVVVDNPAPVPDAAPQPAAATEATPNPAPQPNGAMVQQLPVQLLGALLSASLLVMLL